MSVIGEALLDEEGSVHGWCLDTDAPLTRLTIDILADGEVVASVAASRFREDAQRRGLGDGYCGFSIRLSRQLAASPSLVATAERATGRVFWQKLLRPVPLPGGLPARIEALRATLGGLARSPALTPAPGLAATAAAGFAGLGHALAAHAGAPRLAPSVVLPACANPAVSLILDAGPDTLAALRRAAGGLAGAAAEIILTDDGAGPETLRAQAGFTNLNYLRAPGAGVAQRRNLAIQAARGRVLVLLRGAAGVDAAACAALAAAESIILAPGLAESLARIAPRHLAGLPATPGAGRPDFWAAIPAALRFETGWFDPKMDDGAGLDIADFVLRAARTGAALSVWRPVIAPVPFTWPRPLNSAAGRHFTTRWPSASL